MNSQNRIRLDEGESLVPYQDTEGVWTVGVGHNLQQPITQIESDEYFEKDYSKTCWYCRQYPWYEDMDEVRQAVIENMMFNLGPSRFAGFRKTITLLENKNYEQASFEMLQSKWAIQVGARAARLSEMMKTGRWHT